MMKRTRVCRTTGKFTGAQLQIWAAKHSLLNLLSSVRQQNKKIIAQLRAKGNTLLNYCGVDSDILNALLTKSAKTRKIFARQPNTNTR